jgi:dephospho-CoA kinase
MSGTGKSSVIQALAARGYQAIDTDDGQAARCYRARSNRSRFMTLSQLRLGTAT